MPKPSNPAEPTDEEILNSMRPETRHVFEKWETTPQEKAKIWQGAKKRYRAAHPPAHDLVSSLLDDIYRQEDLRLRKRDIDLREKEITERRADRTLQELEGFTRSMGFSPVGEFSPPPQTDSTKPKQPIRTFLRHFAGLGFFVGSLAMIGIDEYAVAGILLLVSGIAFFVQISEWPLFSRRSRTAQFIKGLLYLSVVLAFGFFAVVYWNRKGEKPWTNAWVNNQTTYCVFIADPTGVHAEYPLSVFVYGKEPMLNVTATVQPVRSDSTPNDIRQLPLGNGTLLDGVHPLSFSVPPGKYIFTVWSRTGLITQELELRSDNGRIVQTANVWSEGKRLFDLYADGTITKVN